MGMTDECMDGLLGFYKDGAVPSFEEMHASTTESSFDGSFGWW